MVPMVVMLDPAMQGGWTALIAASERGNGDLVALLLERGANAEAKLNVCRCVPSVDLGGVTTRRQAV